MTVSVIYCHPCLNVPKYAPAAQAFVRTYMTHPPGITDHELWVGLCGAEKREPHHERLFSPLQPNYLPHNNWGKDIGLFQAAADRIECDLLVCFGAHVHFHRAGWLDRIVGAYLENGPSIYGAYGFHTPRPHIRTTAYWAPPELLRMYPYQIGTPQRYEYEHGSESITLWCKSKGFEPMMVTWRECLPMDRWRNIGCEEALVGDQHQACQ